MVIEKVDRPEPPPTYEIRPTARTTDDRGQKKRGEEERDEYSASGGAKGWQKFHTDAKDRKFLKLRRDDIARLWFKQVFLQKGITIVEIDIGLKNGQVLKSAHTFLTKLDDYWRLKSIMPGQEIAVSEIIREPYVEISVPHRGGIPISGERFGPAGASQTKQIAEEKGFWKLVDPATGKLNSSAVIVYSALIVLLLALIIALLL